LDFELRLSDSNIGRRSIMGLKIATRTSPLVDAVPSRTGAQHAADAFGLSEGTAWIDQVLALMEVQMSDESVGGRDDDDAPDSVGGEDEGTAESVGGGHDAPDSGAGDEDEDEDDEDDEDEDEDDEDEE
jgi:hypothetical protein